jgi:hypothetical protein
MGLHRQVIWFLPRPSLVYTQMGIQRKFNLVSTPLKFGLHPDGYTTQSNLVSTPLKFGLHPDGFTPQSNLVSTPLEFGLHPTTVPFTPRYGLIYNTLQTVWFTPRYN